MSIQYLLAGNTILRFDIQSNGTVSGSSFHPPSALTNTCTQSERDAQTYELKDKQGRVTHKYQQMDSGFAITGYCYDDVQGGRLAYVIPPEAYKQFANGTVTSFTENDVIFKEGIYGYHYDNLGRLNEKHIPGAGWKYSVFDKNDREVLFADDLDKSKGYWQFKKVDALSREIQSGTIHGFGSTIRQTLQTAFDGHSVNTYEDRGNTLYGYTNVSFPSTYAPVDSNIKMVMYYDDYLWNTNTAYTFQSANAFHAQGLSKGILTGTLVRNLETNEWYRHVNYVDYKGRIIQQFSQNHLGGIDRVDYQYRFNGEVLKMRITHKRTGFADIIEVYDYQYNHNGQKISFKHTKDGVTQNVARYDLDAIGRLKTKVFKPSGSVIFSKQTGNWTDVNTWLSGFIPSVNDNVTINLGQTITIPSGQSGSAGILNDRGLLQNFGTLSMGKITTSDLQTVDFSYKIRGSLRGVNLDNAGNLTNKVFSMKLGYEDTGFFDGNIGKQEWKSNIDNVTRSFTYGYDAASRITQGIYASTKANENYSLNAVSYDDNGNIKTLSRNGLKSNNSFGLIDNLVYTYQANSNKIQKVDDSSGETASFTDATGVTDYTYSQDCSLTSDANKGITILEYNYLKKPRRIVKNGVQILYQYDAMGNKLKETIGSNITDYNGNKIYKNGVLYQIAHDEGRIINGEYEYNIKDHLGNLRIAFRDSLGIAKIVQANSYGIWGEDLPTLSFLKSTWKQDNFRFTGKENLAETGYTDFGARLYDNIVPRFITIDPLSEISKRFSLFVYANNNPLRFIDPDGMESVGADGLTTDQWLSARGDSEQEKAYKKENDDKDKDKKKKDEKAKNSLKIPTIDEARNSNGLNPNGDGISPDLTLEGGYIGGKILKPFFGLLGKAWGGLFGKSVWSLNPFERGREIESMLGGNLPGNFPVIDKFVNGVATSIKSVDLSSASYQSASGLRALLNGYVNSVAEFTGRSWAGAQVGTNATNQIISRTLEIAIPRGSITASQQTVMNQIIQNGLNATNPVTVTFIPL